MTAGVRAAAPSLDDGLALLEEQREAMLARDADRLEDINARLSGWIAACRKAPAAPDARIAERLHALRAALDSNSTLARRSALQASRALGALLGPAPRLYTDEGLTNSPAHRRGVRSA
ncbi:MAG: hypothetical protein LT106_18295 [Burkholderiaceae bacterium]|nr:hypothetical protein [Burkholderiaceae bacterium]